MQGGLITLYTNPRVAALRIQCGVIWPERSRCYMLNREAIISAHQFIDKNRTLIAFLICFFVITNVYYFTYFFITPSPGRSLEHPLGWFGWFDQGHYLRQAQAILTGNLDPGNHFYPPLYPAFGAILQPITKYHSFFPVNFGLILIYASIFILLFGRYIGHLAAAGCLLVGMYQTPLMTIQWTVPWTSTASAVWLISALYFLDRYLRWRHRTDWSLRGRLVNAALFGFLIGLLAPTRPGDFIFASPIALTYAGFVTVDFFKGTRETRHREILTGAVGVIFYSLPVLSYLLFNMMVFGDPFGGYFDRIEGSGGILLADFFEKAFSHLLASHVFYGEVGADWLSNISLFLICLAFLPVALFRSPIIFRVAACAFIINMIIVFSFVDALPTGTFRYYNIHYFKWGAPIVLAIAFWFSRRMIIGTGSARRDGLFGMASALAVGLIALSLTSQYMLTPAVFRIVDERTVAIEFPEPTMVDFIELPDIDAGWQQVYFPRGGHVVINGNTPLRSISSYRYLKMPEGTRLVFHRPIEVTTVQLALYEGASIDQQDTPRAQGVRVSLGLGSPLTRPPLAPPVPHS